MTSKPKADEVAALVMPCAQHCDETYPCHQRQRPRVPLSVLDTWIEKTDPKRIEGNP
jgi:hypothetical protein